MVRSRTVSKAGAESVFSISWSILNIQIFYEFRIGLYEVLSKLDFGTHEFGKNSVGFLGVFDPEPESRPVWPGPSSYRTVAQHPSRPEPL
jgi:hypothetical protein